MLTAQSSSGPPDPGFVPAAYLRKVTRPPQLPALAFEAIHMTSASASAAHPLIREGSNADTLGNRFLLSAVAFLRSKQIKDGAAARVERGAHKPTFIAILEVLADRISWSHGDPVPR